MQTASQRLASYFNDCAQAVSAAITYEVSGKLTRAAGLVLEATGLKLPLGSSCIIRPTSNEQIEAEVVGFNEDKLYLMPFTETQGLTTGAEVSLEPSTPLIYPYPIQIKRGFDPQQVATNKVKHFPVGEGLLGRVLDGAGRALDKKGPLHFSQKVPLTATPLNPIDRHPIERPLDVGVRPINTMLTVGQGQRMGLFAGSGVGKSVLLGMMARYTEADITIVGLIGERGREVKEFIDQILGEEGLARSVVVAAPADASPLLRLQGAAYTTVLAEYFRDQGKNVLLIMDSLTRYAMAQREIALAIGEPPATKGYPPSVFAKLPALVERAGNGTNGTGSITAFYTVLTEGDDQQDPIADSARAILDGHIVLNRQLAEIGHYPAIDIEQSISRAMHTITSPEHQNEARTLKSLFSRFQRARDLIQVGAYVAGSDPELDLAIQAYPAISQFLQQAIQEQATYEQSCEQLRQLSSQIFAAQARQ